MTRRHFENQSSLSSGTAAAAASAEFQLQQNTNDVISVNWSNEDVIANPLTENRLYRLFKP